MPDRMTDMRAISISQPGGPDVLQPVRVPMPQPGPDDILIRVSAAGINRPDCLQRAGAYPPPPDASPLPGLEVAGTVVAAGENVTRWQTGDHVCALTPGGGYAEYCITDGRHALPIPAGLTLVEAAALPENAFTVWENVIRRGRLAADETFLVHGGTSGIGSFAIQLAKARGATVIATAGTDAKCTVCLELGADHAVNYREADFVEIVRSVTDGRGADLILDMVGGKYIARNWRAAALEGRIVQIAFLGGSKVELDFGLLMTKRLTHTGSTLRPQSRQAKASLAQALEADVWPLIESGAVRPRIEQVLPLEQAAEAHRRMESGDLVGKLVLETGL